MPRYFFDVWNGEALNRDVDGIDLPNVRHVWEIAVIMVDEIAAAKHDLRSSDSISVIVRDTSDIVVYRSDHHGRVSAPADHRDAPSTSSQRAVTRPS